MITVGVIGANSQVGTETCLFLSGMEGVRVVPICRGELSAAFLRRCGLDCRIGSLDSADGARALLAECDLIVDFALPRGAASAIRPVIDRMVELATLHAPPRARYVYISSIMAFGMPQTGGGFRTRRVSRTIYGALKRHGERRAFRLGRKSGREVWVLRLGQVHGELQGVSQQVIAGLRPSIASVPAGPSCTVFVYSIAEALAHIAAGREVPGRYTLVSTPEWTWAEVLEHYIGKAGVQATISESSVAAAPRTALAGAVAGLRRAGIQTANRAALGLRETIAAYGLRHVPELEQRLRAIYHRRRAIAEIDAERLASTYRPFADCFHGNMPGDRLRSVSDSRRTMQEPAQQVRRLIERAGRV